MSTSVKSVPVLTAYAPPMIYAPRPERRPVWLAAALLGGLLLLLAALGVWLWFSQIEESVPGVGQIIPLGENRVVMSAESGIVRQLWVKKSQPVQAGQVLLSLDPETPQLETAGYQEQLAMLRDESAALEAALQSASGSGAVTSSLQRAWLDSLETNRQEELEKADLEIQQSQFAIQEAEAELAKQTTLLRSQQAQLAQYQALFDQGGLPARELQTYQEKVMLTQGDVARLKETLASRRALHQQSVHKPPQIRSTYQQRLLERLSENRRRISELGMVEAKASVSLKRQVVRAPVDGIVNELAVTGPGHVVQAGQPLITIVPSHTPLVAEVKITNREMSYIHLNQTAALRLDAFPYQRFGRLDGVVTAISPSTATDPHGQPYYTVRIQPQRIQMSDSAGQTQPIRAGMTLTADIRTRERSLLSILTDPVQDQLREAFRDPSGRH